MAWDSRWGNIGLVVMSIPLRIGVHQLGGDEISLLVIDLKGIVIRVCAYLTRNVVVVVVVSPPCTAICPHVVVL